MQKKNEDYSALRKVLWLWIKLGQNINGKI